MSKYTLDISQLVDDDDDIKSKHILLQNKVDYLFSNLINIVEAYESSQELEAEDYIDVILICTQINIIYEYLDSLNVFINSANYHSVKEFLASCHNPFFMTNEELFKEVKHLFFEKEDDKKSEKEYSY